MKEKIALRYATQFTQKQKPHFPIPISTIDNALSILDELCPANQKMFRSCRN